MAHLRARMRNRMRWLSYLNFVVLLILRFRFNGKVGIIGRFHDGCASAQPPPKSIINTCTCKCGTGTPHFKVIVRLHSCSVIIYVVQ